MSHPWIGRHAELRAPGEFLSAPIEDVTENEDGTTTLEFPQGVRVEMDRFEYVEIDGFGVIEV